MHKSNIRNIFFHFWLFFFPLISFLFYRYVGFNEEVCKVILAIAVPFTFVVIFHMFLREYKDYLYAPLIRSIVFFMLFSMLMAYIFWEQPLMLSYRATARPLTFAYFFLLLYVKPNIKLIEKLIYFFCILYLICWSYQMISIPEIIFNQDREIEETRGIRIFINGIGFLYLGLFVCINKFVETKRFFWIFISGGLFIIIIFHLTRQAILFSFIIALYYLLRNSKQLWFYLSFMTVLLYGSNMTFNKDSALVPLIEYTEKQIEAQQSGDEYVRISDYRYYFTEYSKNIITNIFGNGAPHKESAFGKREKQLQTSKSLYVSDVGYAQLFVWYGGLVLLLYLILFYRVVKQKVPAKYMYTKLFLIYVLFTGITSDSILKFTIEISMCLFILEYYNLKEKNEIKHSHNNIEL